MPYLPTFQSASCISALPAWLVRTRGGGVLSPKSYVDVPAGPRKSDYLYTNFLTNFPPISIPFSEKKHPIWIKLGAFYNNLPKIHPIYVIWAPSFLMKTPRSLYQISRKGAPKGRHIYVYHVNVRTPPPGVRILQTVGSWAATSASSIVQPNPRLRKCLWMTSNTVNGNNMLSFSLSTMMCFLTKDWYGFPAYTVNLFIKAYHKITYKEDLKIT